MTLNERLIAALSSAGVPVSPDQYGGDSTEYITFSYSEIPVYFGDNEPEFVRYLISVHWFLPGGVNPISGKRKIRKALTSAGFDAPDITPANDEDGQHYVFETEWLDGEAEG